MPLGDFEKIRELGKGSYGKVYLTKHRKEKKYYAMKVVNMVNMNEEEKKECIYEMDLMKQLSHPNIVAFKENFMIAKNTRLCICMTYCDGSDLQHVIEKAKKTHRTLKEAIIMNFFVQIVLGLNYMHSKHVIHRDIKAQNIFLLGNGRLVLGDLGVSTALNGTLAMARTVIGTPFYMAPEIYNNCPYNYGVDIWALGCVLYEMITLHHPFNGNNIAALTRNILKGTYTPISSLTRGYSHDIENLVHDLLLLNQDERPSTSKILSIPYVKQHLVNFLTDLLNRPNGEIGEGTAMIKNAFIGAAKEKGMDIKKTINLQVLGNYRPYINQLEELGILEDVLTSVWKKKELEDDVNEQTQRLAIQEQKKSVIEDALERLKHEKENKRKRIEDRKVKSPEITSANNNNNNNNNVRRISSKMMPKTPVVPSYVLPANNNNLNNSIEKRRISSKYKAVNNPVLGRMGSGGGGGISRDNSNHKPTSNSGHKSSFSHKTDGSGSGSGSGTSSNSNNNSLKKNDNVNNKRRKSVAEPPTYTMELEKIRVQNIEENKKAHDKVIEQYKSKDVSSVLGMDQSASKFNNFQIVPPPRSSPCPSPPIIPLTSTPSHKKFEIKSPKGSIKNLNDEDEPDWAPPESEDEEAPDELDEKEKELRKELQYTCENMNIIKKSIEAIQRKKQIIQPKVELKVIRDSDSDDSSSNSDDDDDENIHENPRKTIGSIRMRSETLKSQIIKDIGEALFNNCYKYLKDETNRNEGNITLLDIPYIRTNILSLFKTTDVDYALKYAKQVCDLIFMESFG